MTGSSTRLKLRVVPGAGRSGVVGRHGDGWKVRVTAAPERGKANEAVLVQLARVLEVSRGDVDLVAGHRSRDKVAVVRDVPEREIEAKLEAAAGR